MNFDLIKEHIDPKTILDIGANVGYFYMDAVREWPDAKFWLVEGNPACEPALLLLDPESVSIALLSDDIKRVRFWTMNGASTCTGASCYREKTEYFNDDNAGFDLVKTSTLDILCEWPNAPMFDLIKIDTQGSELDILRGGVDTVAHAKAIIMEVSLEEYNEGAPLAPETFAYMDSIGFTRRIKLGDICHPIKRHTIQEDYLFLRE